jgi:transcriptional regulator with GAF, ATPase, and Fis domain
VDRETLIHTGIATATLQGRGARSCVCRVVSGPDAGRQATVALQPFVVGAGADSDLIVNDGKVSRRHVELRLDPGGVRVRDLGSRNGTLCQGARISEAVLQIGTTLQIGETTLRLDEPSRPPVPASTRERFGGLVGESAAIREIFSILDLAAPSDATVVLQGESGTGKEIAARAVHDHSPRAARPFVVVDCSAAKEQLIESDFFGHVRGAFTGAVADRKGAFVRASGGTIFLDEIGELPLASQAKLLRALEAKTVQPLGSDAPIPIDTRVIAATHRDLGAMVAEGTFRFDLFHRLAVVHIFLPPLRERPEDIACLVRHFYEGRGADPGEIGGANLEKLQAYPWPGNVRELRNVLERAFVLAGRPDAPFGELAFWLQADIGGTRREVVDTHLPFKDAKEAWNDEFERRYLATVFERHGHNITHAAKHADINRRHFRKLLIKHGLTGHDGDDE